MSERIFLLRHNYIFYCSQVVQIFTLCLLFHFLLRCRTVEYESQQYQCHDHPSGQCCCSQTCKFIIVTFQIDYNDNRRNSIGNIIFQTFREFHACTGIHLCNEIVLSPSVLSGTKQKVTKTSKRKKVIRNNKVFQIHDVTSISEWLESGKYIESKHTWNA